MKLPFVSRAHADQQDHNLGKMRSANHVLQRANDRLRGERDEARSAVQSWKALFDAERIRCEALTQKLLDMKQAGFTTATQRQEQQAAVPSRIELAIQEKAGSNTRLARYLSNVAAGMERARKSEDEIVESLTQWRDPDEEADATA